MYASRPGVGSGIQIDQKVFHVYEFREDKVSMVRGYLERGHALEAAGLQE